MIAAARPFQFELLIAALHEHIRTPAKSAGCLHRGLNGHLLSSEAAESLLIARNNPFAVQE